MRDRQVCEFLEGRRRESSIFIATNWTLIYLQNISTIYLQNISTLCQGIFLKMDIVPENILQSTVLKIFKEKQIYCQSA